MPSNKLVRNIVIAVAVVAIALVVVEVAITTMVAVPVAQPTTAVVTKGGSVAKLSSPVGLPTDLPLPAGTVTGSSGTSPNWSIAINIDGEYTAVMRRIRTFYLDQGFTDLSPGTAIPFGFANAKYTLQVVGRNHDHTGPLSTDVTIVAHLK